MKQPVLELPRVNTLELAASFDGCVLRFEDAETCLFTFDPVTCVVVTVRELEGPFTVTETILEITLIVVTCLIVLFADPMKETILELAFIYRAEFVQYLFALPVLLIREVMSSVALFLGVMLPVPLQTPAHPLTYISVTVR